MERMIEVLVDIYDSVEYDRWLKFKETEDDDGEDEVEKLVRKANAKIHAEIERPTPTISKFRFFPSTLVGVYETYSMEMSEKKGKKKLDNVMLIFNTGLEQRANLSLKEWDELFSEHVKTQEAREKTQMQEGYILTIGENETEADNS